MNDDALIVDAKGHLGDQSIERPLRSLRRFTTRRAQRAHPHVRIASHGRCQEGSRLAGAFERESQDDIGATEIDAFVSRRARSAFRNHVRLFEQLGPTRVRGSQ